jgi:hypothetical protein
MIMKSLTPLFIAIALVLSLSSVAQRSVRNSVHAKAKNAELLSQTLSDNDQASVVSYHVEERVNMNFGGRIVTYEVSKLSLVSTNDLGENNVRVITPKYAKTTPVKVTAKAEPVAVPSVQPVVSAEPLFLTVNPVVPTLAAKPERIAPKSVNIDILGTYERVLDKGYQSLDMLKRVANARYFDGDLVTAAKWYNQLFSQTTGLDAEFYFRYAQALKATNQEKKAQEMMAIFEAQSAK